MEEFQHRTQCSSIFTTGAASTWQPQTDLSAKENPALLPGNQIRESNKIPRYLQSITCWTSIARELGEGGSCCFRLRRKGPKDLIMFLLLKVDGSVRPLKLCIFLWINIPQKQTLTSKTAENASSPLKAPASSRKKDSFKTSQKRPSSQQTSWRSYTGFSSCSLRIVLACSSHTFRSSCTQRVICSQHFRSSGAWKKLHYGIKTCNVHPFCFEIRHEVAVASYFNAKSCCYCWKQ